MMVRWALYKCLILGAGARTRSARLVVTSYVAVVCASDVIAEERTQRALAELAWLKSCECTYGITPARRKMLD